MTTGTYEHVKRLSRPSLEMDMPTWDARTNEMIDVVLPWFSSHTATIRCTRHDPAQWYLIGPDAGQFPRLQHLSKERALWIAHHIVGYRSE
jgi:hypothetical protein